jgi:hypothetical protein
MVINGGAKAVTIYSSQLASLSLETYRADGGFRELAY